MIIEITQLLTNNIISDLCYIILTYLISFDELLEQNINFEILCPTKNYFLTDHYVYTFFKEEDVGSPGNNDISYFYNKWSLDGENIACLSSQYIFPFGCDVHDYQIYFFQNNHLVMYLYPNYECIFKCDFEVIDTSIRYYFFKRIDPHKLYVHVKSNSANSIYLLNLNSKKALQIFVNRSNSTLLFEFDDVFLYIIAIDFLPHKNNIDLTTKKIVNYLIKLNVSTSEIIYQEININVDSILVLHNNNYLKKIFIMTRGNKVYEYDNKTLKFLSSYFSIKLKKCKNVQASNTKLTCVRGNKIIKFTMR